jgi:hypothetical protein
VLAGRTLDGGVTLRAAGPAAVPGAAFCSGLGSWARRLCPKSTQDTVLVGVSEFEPREESWPDRHMAADRYRRRRPLVVLRTHRVSLSGMVREQHDIRLIAYPQDVPFRRSDVEHFDEVPRLNAPSHSIARLQVRNSAEHADETTSRGIVESIVIAIGFVPVCGERGDSEARCRLRRRFGVRRRWGCWLGHRHWQRHFSEVCLPVWRGIQLPIADFVCWLCFGPRLGPLPILISCVGSCDGEHERNSDKRRAKADAV